MAGLACGGNEPNRTPAAILAVSGNNQAGVAGAPLPLPLVVRVNDANGRAVEGVRVSFAVQSGRGSLSVPSVVTNRQGTVSVSWTLGPSAAESQTATAAVAGLSGSPLTFVALTEAGPAVTARIVSGGNQSGEVGQPLPLPVTVEFADVFGNPAAGEAATVTVTAGGGSAPATAVTDLQGRVQVAWTLGYLVGPGAQGLRVQVAAAPANVQATGVLSAGTLEIAGGNDQLGLASQALALPVGVRVRTAGNHAVAGVAITWAVASGGGSVASPTSVSDASGLATAAWTLGPDLGVQTVTAANPTLTPPSLTLSATAVVPQPSSITGNVTVTASSGVGTPLRAGLRLRGGNLRGPEPAGVPQPSRAGRPVALPGDLIVTFHPQAVASPGLRAMRQVATARTVAQAIRSRLALHEAPGRVRVAGVSPLLHAARISVADPARADSVARALAADPAVRSVMPNYLAYPDGLPADRSATPAGTIPNDPNYPNQSWHYAMVGLPRAWSITTGSASVIVAMLDNGIVFHHPGIGAAGATYLTGGGNLLADGYDFAAQFPIPLCSGGSVDNADDGDGYDPDPSIPDDLDPSNPGCLGGHLQFGGHGLHTAGTVGAIGNDNYSVTGINWTVHIRPVRVLGLQSGDYFDIAQGVLYAAGLPADDGHGGVLTPPAAPARIINMSLGGPCPMGPDPAPGADLLHDAIVAVTDPGLPGGGVLVVASAGNDATAVPPCPAAYSEVLAVGAVGPSGARASYSNYGPWVGIAAPGGEVNAPDGTYWVYSTMCDFTPLAASPTALCTPTQARLPGTSMAAPHVSGVAALLLAANPALTAADLRARLTSYVTPLDPAQEIGPGIVNAWFALTQTTGPSHELFVRAYDAATGAAVATVPAPAGQYLLSALPDGSYLVYAGQDENGDGVIGLPDRLFGAFGGAAQPTPIAVSSTTGAFASFSIGTAVEAEPNQTAASASRLVMGGTMRGFLDATDPVDLYRVDIAAAGAYVFETAGVGGDFCSFALDVNTTLDLLDANLSPIQTSVDIDASRNNYCSRISANLAPGTYYLRVTPGDFFGLGTHSGRYLLQARAGP
jgi:subtilisin family serine protease